MRGEVNFFESADDNLSTNRATGGGRTSFAHRILSDGTAYSKLEPKQSISSSAERIHSAGHVSAHAVSCLCRTAALSPDG